MKRFLPHIISFAVMLLVTTIIFSPMLSGKKLVQGDNLKAQSFMSELREFKAETGRVPLWTNRNFSGMPSFQILMEDKTNLTVPVFEALLAGQGVGSNFMGLLLAMLSMYLFMLTLGSDWRVALGGALAYAGANYFADLSEAGHNTKLVALAYAPAIFAAAILAFKRKYLLGGALMALAVALQIYANHFQITYYTFLILGLFFLVSLINILISKDRQGDESNTLKNWAMTALVCGLGLGIGLMANTSKLWTTMEYQAETTRGKSELTGKADGLNKDYANDWSISGREAFDLLIPNYTGGGASLDYSKDNSAFTELVRNNMAQRVPADQLDKVVSQQVGSSLYWGGQPFVGVPIYFGAALFFLFLFGAMTTAAPYRGWLITGFIFSVLVALGDHTPFGSLMFDYFPYYNKFRAVSMALGLTQLMGATLAMLGLQKMLDGSLDAADVRRKIYIAAGSTIGIMVLAMFFAGNMKGQNDDQLKDFASMLYEKRSSMIRSDIFRGIFFIVAVAGLVLAALRGMIKPRIATLAVVGLLAVDHIMIDKRSLNDSDFSMGSDAKQEVEKSPADERILQDKDASYRVLDLSRGNPFTNSAASSFHQNVGGYHAAKLMRYQELVDSILNKPSSYPNVLNMLNVKHIIDDKGQPLTNAEALGNAWFAREIKVVDNADLEIQALRTLDTRNVVLMQKKYADQLGAFTPQYDSTNTIKLTKYVPDNLAYEYSAKTDQIAVFSEIYYPEAKGWHLYLNGKRLPGIVKANYLLRAAKVPAGQNQKLEMKFEPNSFKTGNTFSLIGSILTLLAILGGLFLAYRRGQLRADAADLLPENALFIPEVKARPATSARQPAPRTDNRDQTRKKK
jgi:hypothetical protein